jgi:hypothetical protein
VLGLLSYYCFICFYSVAIKALSKPNTNFACG